MPGRSPISSGALAADLAAARIAGQPQQYYEEDVGLFEADDVYDTSIFEFYSDPFVTKQDLPQLSIEALPHSEEWEDPDLLSVIDEFFWANAPPLGELAINGSITLPDGEEPEDEDFGFTLGIAGTDLAAAPDQIYAALPELEEQEDEDFSFSDMQLPADFVPPMSLGILYFEDEVEEPEDEPFGFEFFAVGGETDPVGGMVEMPEEPDDEDYSFAFTLQDDDYRPVVVLPDDEELDDEAFGFELGIAGADVVAQPDQIYPYFQDQEEEPEDEDFTHVDFQIGLEVDQVTQLFPDQADEPEDEDYGISSDYQIVEIPPADLIVNVFPDQSEEPEDEDFGFIDYQSPPDDTGETVGYYLDEAEEPEDEDWGFSFVLQDDDAQGAIVFPDESDEPEDEDFGSTSDYQLVELPPAADQIYPYFQDQEEEPEDEDFGFSDVQIGMDIEPDLIINVYSDEAEEPEDEDFGNVDFQLGEEQPPPPPVVIPGSGGAVGGGGGRELNALFRKKEKEPKEFPGRKPREILEDMALPPAAVATSIPATEAPAPDDDSDWLLLL